MSFSEFITSIAQAVKILFGEKDQELNVKKENYNLLDENRNLRLENEKMKNRDITRNQLTYRGNSYYLNNEGPFCTTCFDKNGVLIRLDLRALAGKKYKLGRCNSCESHGIETDVISESYEEKRKTQIERINKFNDIIKK